MLLLPSLNLTSEITRTSTYVGSANLARSASPVAQFTFSETTLLENTLSENKLLENTLSENTLFAFHLSLFTFHLRRPEIGSPKV